MARKTTPSASARKTTRRTDAPLEIRRDATSTEVSAERRTQMIAECAYYIAAARGFEPGNELADWLTAEAAIARQLA